MTTEYERGRPQDLQAETDLLCACLQEPRWADLALEGLETGDFASEAHQTIFSAIRRLRRWRAEPDARAVCSELRRINAAPEVVSYAAVLPEQWIPLGRQVEQRLAVVRQQAALRRIINAAGTLQDRAFGQPDDPAKVIDEAIEELAAAREAWQPQLAPRLRTFHDLELLPPPTWAWPGWLANGHVSMLFGPPGAGKSYAALALCGPITQAAPWPDGQAGPAETATVLLLDYEMTHRATLERAKALGLALHRLLTQPEELTPYLNRPESIGIIEGWLEETRARLLVIDSLRDALPGCEENDAAVMAGALHPLKMLAARFDIPILLLHHSRKGQPTNASDRWELSMDDLRGSSALAGSVRTILAVDKPALDRDTRRLRIVKSNFAAFPQPLGFEVDESGLSWTEAPYARQDMPARCAAEEAIRIALQRQPMRFTDLQRELEEQGISKRTMLRALKEVATKGNDGRWGLRAAV